MVERKITRKKPKRAFVEKVLSRISEVQVFLPSAEGRRHRKLKPTTEVTITRIETTAKGMKTIYRAARPRKSPQLLVTDEKRRCFAPELAIATNPRFVLRRAGHVRASGSLRS